MPEKNNTQTSGEKQEGERSYQIKARKGGHRDQKREVHKQML